MNKIRTQISTLVFILCLLLSPLSRASAFDLIELDLEITLNQPQFSFSFDQLNQPKTGFTLFNPEEASLQLASAFLPSLGLLPEEDIQQGFVLYDGTLYLEVAANDSQSGRATLRTTYRMSVDGRQLERAFLRNLFVRQGRYDDARARVRARAARLADARVMRFVEDENGGGRWVRAVRALSTDARANIRFMPRMEPDGVLGHYGYNVDVDGNAFVWAVVDKNSRYAVGLNVDDDNDGVFNRDDNCRNSSNPDQMDTDVDGLGNECDSDDDGDGVEDELDNCPLIENAAQDDVDGDGAGDVCDLDDDNDGVLDNVDACPVTFTGSVVDAQGCSVDDRCPCDNSSGWKNHGSYVRCVAKASEALLEVGLLTTAEKDALVSQAAQSKCGHR